MLEIGQGNGLSTGLILDRLPHGRYLGLDRSAPATAAAAERHADAVAAGRATFITSDVTAADLPAASFDVVLAVNVNLFWTADPSATLQRIRAWLRSGGRIGLIWEPPGEARAAEIAERVPPALEAAGFEVTVERATTTKGAPLVGVLGTLP